MKYANYSYHNKRLSNLGDQAQILAFDYIYQQMGIDSSEIVYLKKEEMAEYDGEPVILPVNMPLCDYCQYGFAGRFSDKIIPVFLGLALMKESLLPEEILYFKRYEPIGCRDERTYHTLSKNGINAYLGGCVTVILPKRTASSAEQRDKIFVVDPAKGIETYIPEEIRRKAVFCSHNTYNPEKDSREAAIERYKEYADSASLVITSLLHCSVPCTAMGIPVILARDHVSYRFGWLEKLIHIYTTEEYGKIDWKPNPADYEPYKRFMLEFIKRRLRGEDCTKEIKVVHDFYMNRDRKEYIDDEFLPIKDYLDRNWTDCGKAYKYAIWGLTQMAEFTIDYINQRYPNAQLSHVYDIAHTWKLRGIKAEHPENLENYPDETVFVTTWAAYIEAKQYFERIGRPENSYALYSI